MAKGNLKENILVSTGNRVAVVMNGVEVGLCQSVRCSDNYNLQAASGIGDIHVQEWVPTQAVHQITAQTMVLFIDDLKGASGAGAIEQSSMRGALSTSQNGDIMNNGDAVLRGLTFDLHIQGKAPSSRNSNSGASGIKSRLNGGQALRDTDFQKTIRVYYDCTFESGDIDVTKHQIIVSNAVFRALDATSYPGNDDYPAESPLTATNFQI